MRRAVVGASAVVLLAVVLLAELPFETRTLAVNQPSPDTYRVPSDRRVVDDEATRAARGQAQAAVEPAYKTDAEANGAMVKQVSDFFDSVLSTSNPVPLATTPPPSTAAPPTAPGEPPPPDPAGPPPTSIPTAEERYASLRQKFTSLDKSNPDGVKALAAMSRSDVNGVRDRSLDLLREAIKRPIRDVDVDATRRDIGLAVGAVPPETLLPEVAHLVNTLLSSVLRPNTVIDPAATDARRREAAERVAPVDVLYRRGQVIASLGDRLTPEQVQLLKQLGLGKEAILPRVLGVVLLSMVLVAVLGLWLRSSRPRLFHSIRSLVMLVSLLVGFAAASALLTSLSRYGNSVWGYLVPAATLTMLACILTDAGTAVALALWAGLIVGVASRGNFAYAGFAATAGMVPIPFVSRLSARSDLVRATWRTGLGVGVAAGLFSYLSSPSRMAALVLVAGVANGLLAGFLTVGLLPFFENIFDVLTPTRLLDLTDRNHPLLRELEEKAIGTYNHSIMVGTLAERAARRIGANGLLCRAAAYYHDIGKTRRPYFFVENQLTGDNPHDRISPAVSAVIIKDHVVDGMKMAKEYKIPVDVAEGIVTHHGTGRIQYFLSKAAVDGQVLDEEVFRHVGRRPRTKEMAILMLADSCEGAARALAQSHSHRVTPDGVADVVERIITQKAEDGQLDECDLTFADLAEVRASFTEALVGLYHPRIEYPPLPASIAAHVESPVAQSAVRTSSRRKPRAVS